MPTETNSIGVITAAEGEVFAESDSGMRALEPGSAIYQGEKLVTGAGGNVEVRFADDTLLSQGGDSVISLDDYVFDSSGAESADLMFKMAQGTFRVVTGKIAEQNPERFKLGSPLATIGIRGTIVVSEITPGGGEKIGVEEIHSGRALLVQGLDGTMRMISSPMGMVDISASGRLGDVRPMSMREFNNFRSIAPTSIRQEQEIREERQQEPEDTDDPGPDNDPGGGDIGEAGGEPEGGGVFGVEGVMDPGDGAFLGSQVILGAPLSGELPALGNTGGTLTGGPVLIGGDVGGQQVLPQTGNQRDEPLDPVEPQETVTTNTDTSSGNSENAITSGGDSGGDTVTTYVGTSGNDSLTGTERSETFWGMAGDDTIEAMCGNDTLYGGEGSDTLSGGHGDDVLAGGDGVDTIKGEDGIDFVDYSEYSTAVTVDLSNNTASANGSGDEIYTVEGIIGGSGDDNLKGDTGNNTFRGGEGNDTFDGVDGIDTVDYSSRSEGVFANLNTPAATIIGTSEVDTLTEIDKLIGSTGNDTIWGDSVNNTIGGGGGNDTLSGGGLYDYDYLDYSWLKGGTGVVVEGYYNSATLNQSYGREEVSGFEGVIGSDYGDTITGDSNGAFTSTIFAGDGDDRVYGSADGYNEHLLGQAGDDILFGDSGEDTLEGGTGKDTLTGGDGNDFFHYSSTDDLTGATDEVTDFNRSEGDKFQFYSGAFNKDGFAYASGYDGTLSGGETGAYFIWDTSTNTLIYDADVTSEGFETVATTNSEALLESDIMLVGSGGP
ncbi:FecR domain-containing protein [Maridesulfovibrio sp.]|uniref:FecR domain-containing protein n=1 Tax=Maridesulfovibrio sp. TaxID=2795000 RepID=UPI003BAB0681